MLTFQNDGEIDILAATTFGVNAKVNESPIGFFGTGLKYAIAIILRSGGSITIYSGTKKFTFGLKAAEVRGQEFQVITMNKKPQGWTTRMGINWQPWQCFRELYCNAKDEGGYATNRKLKPEAGKTTIVVEGFPALVECFEKRSAFFLEGEQLFRGMTCEVYNGESAGIYYRGILVGQFERPAAFTYNITMPVDLTEDRTLKYPWQVPNYIATAWLKTQRSDLLEQALTVPRETMEHTLGFSTNGHDPSETFMETVGQVRKGPRSGLLNQSARDLHDKLTLSSGADPEEVELLPQERVMVEHAYALIEKLQVIPEPRRFKLHVCNTLGSGILGRAHRGKIFLSRRVFEWGQNTVTGTLFEELCHAALDMKDNDRDFQNFLINQIARLAERL